MPLIVSGSRLMHLFATVYAYTMGKSVLDMAAAVQAEIDAGEAAEWPGFRTLARLRQVAGGPVTLTVSHSSLIAKARSLALGAFLASDCDAWLQIDDDVDAPAEDLRRMLDALAVIGHPPPIPPDVLLMPCALRGGEGTRLNIVAALTRPGMQVRGNGVQTFGVHAGGLALSLVTRQAANILVEKYPELAFLEWTEGSPEPINLKSRPGLGVFLESVENGAWIGEDFAFCARARQAGLRIEALAGTSVTHAGVCATVDPAYLAGAGNGSPPSP